MKRIGFTLIEMLVVVAIIGLLASVMVTAAHKAKEAAKKTDIRHQVTQLKAAWELTYIEMKKFPSEVSANAWTIMDQQAVWYLHGSNDNNFIYMDFSTNEINNSSASTGGMRDKFYGQIYHIAFDHKACGNDNGTSYDGLVKYANGDLLNTHVAVWHGWKDTNSVVDDIRSWKEF